MNDHSGRGQHPTVYPAFTVPWKWGPIVLAVASVVLFVYRHQVLRSQVQVMAKGIVKVYVQAGDQVVPLDKAGVLSEGAHVRAEITASEATAAFWAVHSRDMRLLTETPRIWRDRLDLPAGATASFRDSMQLAGSSVGETLCVVQCPAASITGDALPAEIESALTTGAAVQGAFSDCSQECYPLRS